MFNLLTGVYPPSAGSIKVIGRDTRGLAPHDIAHLGCARTFQNIRLFRELTAFDNVRIACHHLTRETMAAAVRQGALSEQEEKWIAERAAELLEIMGLSHRRDEVAKNLPYGEQRRLEIARALATGPQVLLLDEPAAGTNTREKADLMALISNSRVTFSLTSTPPVSSAAFHETPQSLRLMATLPSKPIRSLPNGSLAAPWNSSGMLIDLVTSLIVRSPVTR